MAHLSRFDLSNIKINLGLSGGLCARRAPPPPPRRHLCSCPMHHPRAPALAPAGVPGAGINHPAAVLGAEPIACSAARDHRGNHTARPRRGRGRRRAQAEIYLFDFTGLGDFFFFFSSSLKRPPGNCSPWNINATQDASSLKCHLAVIPPALIIPWGARAPIPLRPQRCQRTGQPQPSPCRSACTSPKWFLALFHHRSGGC